MPPKDTKEQWEKEGRPAPNGQAKSVSKKITRKCPVDLTRDELLEAGEDLASAQSHLDATHAELKAVKSEYKGRLDEIASRIGRLTSKIGSKSEVRDVACVHTSDFTNGRIIITRTDTGKILEDRPMTESEKQTEIQFEQKEPPIAPNDGEAQGD